MAKLFSWGANSYGQLSVGHASEKFTTPQQVTFEQAKSINYMAAGGGHIIVKTSTNGLFSCGSNSKGQLGNGTMTDSSLLEPVNTKVFGKKSIISLHCGWQESAAVCDDGSLFVWGSNVYGQLGQSRDRKFVTKPVLLPLPNDEKAVSINFTFRCSVIVTSNRRAYVVGELRHFDDLKKSPSYKEIIHEDIMFVEIGTDIDKLSCGQNHFIFAHSDNSVSGFGTNQYGQIDRVEFSHPIDKILSGWKFNGALLRTGDVLLWGRNTYGQLGRNTHGINLDAVRTPIRLQQFSEKYTNFCLGAEHGLAITKRGEVLTFGWNEHGNCGNGDVENVYKPYRIAELRGKCVAAVCGSGFCFALIAPHGFK